MTTLQDYWESRKCSIQSAIADGRLKDGAIELGYVMEDLRTVLSLASKDLSPTLKRFSIYTPNKWCESFTEWYKKNHDNMIDFQEELDVWREGTQLCQTIFLNRHQYAHSKGKTTTDREQSNLQQQSLKRLEIFVEQIARHTCLRENINQHMEYLPSMGEIEKNAHVIGRYMLCHLSRLHDNESLSDVSDLVYTDVLKAMIQSLESQLNYHSARILKGNIQDFFSFLQELDQEKRPMFVLQQSKVTYQRDVFDAMEEAVQKIFDKYTQESSKLEASKKQRNKTRALKESCEMILHGIKQERGFFRNPTSVGCSESEQRLGEVAQQADDSQDLTRPDILLLKLDQNEEEDGQCMMLKQAVPFSYREGKLIPLPSRIDFEEVDLQTEYDDIEEAVESFLILYRLLVEKNSIKSQAILVLEMAHRLDGSENLLSDWGRKQDDSCTPLLSSFMAVATMANKIYGKSTPKRRKKWSKGRLRESEIDASLCLECNSEQDIPTISFKKPGFIRVHDTEPKRNLITKYNLHWPCTILATDAQWASLKPTTKVSVIDFLKSCQKNNQNYALPYIPCILSIKELDIQRFQPDLKKN